MKVEAIKRSHEGVNFPKRSKEGVELNERS